MELETNTNSRFVSYTAEYYDIITSPDSCIIYNEWATKSKCFAISSGGEPAANFNDATLSQKQGLTGMATTRLRTKDACSGMNARADICDLRF